MRIAFEHIRKGIDFQRQHLALAKGNAATRAACNDDDCTKPRKVWDDTQELSLLDATGKSILTENGSGSQLAGLLSNRADVEHFSPEYGRPRVGCKDGMEKLYRESIELARRYGNATVARTPLAMLANLYSGCHNLEIPEGLQFGTWSEQEVEPGWRLNQAALLRSELRDIAALTGRTVETECCICLDDLEGDGTTPVIVNQHCFHSFHLECAAEHVKSRPDAQLLAQLGASARLKCPLCIRT